ncbi:MAG: hypothetical protein OHK0045_13000 [Raineya sp.]
MKKLLYTLTFLASSVFFMACEKSAPVVYTGEKFVHFQDTLLSITEGSAKEDANGTLQIIPSIVTLRINRATTDISKELVVSFSVKAKYVAIDTVTGSPTNGEEIELGDVPATDYFLSSPTAVTIKAGEAFAFVTLTAKDNNITDGNKKLTFTLESTSDASFTLGYPGPAKKAKSMVVYINDDDCPLDINDFVGTLKVKEFSARLGDVRNYTITSTQVGPSSISVIPFFDPMGTDLAPNGPNPIPVTINLNEATKSAFIPTQPAFQYTAGSLAGAFRHAVDGGSVGLAPSQLNTCEKTLYLSYIIQNISSGGILEIVELGEYKK